MRFRFVKKFIRDTVMDLSQVFSYSVNTQCQSAYVSKVHIYYKLSNTRIT